MIKKVMSYGLGVMSILFLVLLLTPHSSLLTPAQAAFSITQPANGGVNVSTQTGEGLLQTVIGNVIIILFTIAGVGAVIMFLWGAIEWILSGGDKEKVAKSRGRIINAIIGLVLIALAFLIIRVVGQIIGFNPLEDLTLPNIGGQTPVSQCTPADENACRMRGFRCVTTPGQGVGYRCL